MGSSSSKPLADLSKEEVAAAVGSLGAKLEKYSNICLENAVDGAILASVSSSEQEMKETLDDLEITNRLHRRVLLKEWKRAVADDAAVDGGHGVRRRSSSGLTSKNNKKGMNARVAPLPKDLHDFNNRKPSMMPPRDTSSFHSPEYDFDSSTPPDELTPYDEITAEMMAQTNPSTHFVSFVSLVVEDGHLSLSTKVTMGQHGKVLTKREHRDRNSLCYQSVNDGTDRSFYVCEVPPKLFEPPESTNQNGRKLWYSGFAIRNEHGKKVGMVCIMEYTRREKLSLKRREDLLRQLAENVAHQLQLRKALLARRSSLERQVASLSTKSKRHGDIDRDADEVILPSSGPLKEVRRSQVQRRVSSNNKVGMTSSYHRASPLEIPGTALEAKGNTRDLPIFAEIQASESEMSHLPDDFFQACEMMGAPKPPIARNDMDRLANAEALGLVNLRPGNEIVNQLQGFVNIAADLFGFPHVEINFQQGNYQFGICAVDRDEQIKSAMSALTQVVTYHEDQVTPFMRKMDRAVSFCNYPIAVGKTFVVHDVEQDMTFDWWAHKSPVRSYAGCPIRAPNGHVIGMVCMVDTKPRPDFQTAHEMQLEQISSMAMHCIENFFLRRDIMRLEQERLELVNLKDKTKPPRGKVTIVVTDIQGSTSMWEEQPAVMQEAQDLHDEIIRRKCSQHFGYEIDTEGDSFLLAFHEPVDAFAFALNTQLALFNAAWSPSLLSMSNAADDGYAFRGLRVRMGIHHGEVNVRENGLTSRVMYEGATLQMAKSIESMCHGGQILTSLKTWKLAEFFAETSLDCPQVLDLGAHIVPMSSRSVRDGMIRERVIQLVPKILSLDYFAVRNIETRTPELTPTVQSCGRQFHPIKSLKAASHSFHDAPHENNEVTIGFVDSSKIRDHFLASEIVAASIDNLIQSTIEVLGIGYQCQLDMIAFRSPSEAIQFGLYLRDRLNEREPLQNGDRLGDLVKFGCVHDVFLTMGPHKTTGRADYFGKVVNRAARVTNAATLGSVSFGVVGPESLQGLSGNNIRATFIGMCELKGVKDEMARYECDWRMNKNGDI